jgi:hypothetical protein
MALDGIAMDVDEVVDDAGAGLVDVVDALFEQAAKVTVAMRAMAGRTKDV